MAPVNVESPVTTFPPQVLAWSMPEDMLDSAVSPWSTTCSRRRGRRRRPWCPLLNPDGTTLANLESFDGSQRYFGSIMANCERAMTFAVPYLLGQPYPKGVMLPDYNLDADRGYAWPCWDVDWAAPRLDGALPLERLRPLSRWTRPPGWGKTPGINWGSGVRARGPARGPGFTVNDPFGSPRSGTAWVNATALSSPGAVPVRRTCRSRPS